MVDKGEIPTYFRFKHIKRAGVQWVFRFDKTEYFFKRLLSAIKVEPRQFLTESGFGIKLKFARDAVRGTCSMIVLENAHCVIIILPQK